MQMRMIYNRDYIDMGKCWIGDLDMRDRQPRMNNYVLGFIWPNCRYKASGFSCFRRALGFFIQNPFILG